jgi:acylphosphatase
MSIAGKHIIFIGHVQGIGFRFTAMRIANSRNLTGWVKNLPDGSVEMSAYGTEDDLQQCISEIHDYFGSNIKETNIADIAVNDQYEDFRITF